VEAQSNWSFVEAGWFQAISVVVVISSIALACLEGAHPDMRESLDTPEQVILSFFAIELLSRLCYINDRRGVSVDFYAWLGLDVLIVLTGLVDQFVLPNIELTKNGKSIAFLCFLLLRLLRIGKVINILGKADLSWAESGWFQSLTGTIIGINSILLGMETDINWDGWKIIEQVLLCFYVFEITVRLKKDRLYFFNCRNPDITWNLLDFVIVASSVIDTWVMPFAAIVMKMIAAAEQPEKEHAKSHGFSLAQIMMLMRMLRLMRILRLVRLVKSVKPLIILIASVLDSLQGVAWVLLLAGVMIYAMAILTTRLIGQGLAGTMSDDILLYFKSVPDSMFTLFLVMSGAAGDAETGALSTIMSDFPAVKLGFVFFLVTSSWILLAVMNAVLTENFISTTAKQEAELKLSTFEEDRAEQRKKLKDVLGEIDEDHDGLLHENQVLEIFKDEDRARVMSRDCGLPLSDIKEVMHILSHGGERVVELDTLVDYLLDLGNQATEKSLLKLEMSILKMHQRLEATVKKIGENLAESSDCASKETRQVPWSKAVEEEVEQQSKSNQMAAKTRSFASRMSISTVFRTAPEYESEKAVEMPTSCADGQLAEKTRQAPDSREASGGADNSVNTTLASTAPSLQAKGMLASTTASSGTSPPSQPAEKNPEEDELGLLLPLPLGQDLGQRAIELLRQAISAEHAQQRDDIAERLGDVLQSLLRDAKQPQETEAPVTQQGLKQPAAPSSDKPREAPYSTPRTPSSALLKKSPSSHGLVSVTGEEAGGTSVGMALRGQLQQLQGDQLPRKFPPEDGERGRSRSSSLARASDAIPKADDSDGDRRREKKRSGTGGAGESESSSAEQARLSAAPGGNDAASPSRILPPAESTGQSPLQEHMRSPRT